MNNREDQKTSLADTNNFLESFTLQPNFDYFQTCDFHKLQEFHKLRNCNQKWL